MRSHVQVLGRFHQVLLHSRAIRPWGNARQLSWISYAAQRKQQNNNNPNHSYECTYRAARSLNTTRSLYRDVLLPGNLVQSPMSDVELPENSTLHDVIFEKCDKFKDLPACSDFVTGRSYTYSQLKENVIRVASALHRRGYKKGDVILIISNNHIDFTVLQFAASCLGCWFSGANPTYNAEELARQIHHSQCKAIFAIESLTDVVNDALGKKDYPHNVQELFVFGESPGMHSFQSLTEDSGDAFPKVEFDAKEDVCVLPYSSGTTGFPKGVMLTHHNIVSNIVQLDHYNSQKEGDNILCLLPLFHAFAQLFIQFATLYNGGQYHNLTHFDPQTFLQCLQDKEINNASLVPPLVLFLTKHPMVDKYDLSKLTCVMCAAAPLGKELSEGFLKRFPHIRLLQGYGLTEASPGINLDQGQTIGSVGPLLPNTLAKIVDLDTGENLGPHQEGELCAKGPQMMKGYFNNPEASKEMLREDGWMHTGDVAYYDDKGLFYICDRLKELIKVKGFQVAPAELEAILIGHPEVADACVIGIPDDKCGEVPKAFVVKNPDSDVTGDVLVEFIKAQVSETKRLRGGVEFIDQIPKNPSGKILRRLLRNRK